MKWRRAAASTAAALGAVTAYDLTQQKRAILRNFPVVGHLRCVLERFGPERRWVYASSNWHPHRPLAARGLRLPPRVRRAGARATGIERLMAAHATEEQPLPKV